MKGIRPRCGSRLVVLSCLLLLAEIGSAFFVPSSTASITNGGRQRRGEASPSPPSSSEGATTTTTRLQMSFDPLATEGDWTAYLDDETTGLIYYFNDKTGESLWEPPTKTFPAVKMSRKQKRVMTEKREEYEASMAEETAEEEEGGGGGGFFGLFGRSAKDDQVADEEVEEDAPAEVVDEIVEEVMTAPKFSFANVFSRPPTAQTSSAGGVIEEAFEEQQDEDAYVGKYRGEQVADETVEEVEVEQVPVAKAPSKKLGGFPGMLSTFKLGPKEAEIIIPSDSPIQIEMSSKVVPSPEKVSWGGEDALFTKGRTFGVFDGVSGAEKVDGVALFSFTLAKQMKDLIDESGLTIEEMTDALTTAAEIANMEATGASTAVVASIGEDGYLRALNVGDCVVVVYRKDGQVVAKTKEILHYFDCPYQLADDSPDKPRDGTTLKVELQPGDVIVAGSDGIFDNLTEEQVWDQISSVPAKAGMMAGKLIKESRAVSLDPEAPTPYAKQAKKNRYEEYKTGLGGKLDDISCVVVRCL